MALDTENNPPGPSTVLVVETTGTSNLQSICAGLKRAGANPVLIDDANRVVEFDGPVVVPGVGTFDAALKALQLEQEARVGGAGGERSSVAGETQRTVVSTMAAAITARLREQRPTAFVCVGLQILASTSEEGPSGWYGFGQDDLGLREALVKKFPDTVKVPQHGWNWVEPTEGCRYVSSGRLC